MQTLTTLIDTIRQLAPAQRRHLWRRLQVMGLLDREDLLTDRDALQIVPAVQKPSSKPVVPPATPTNGSADPTYRSPVSGRVVVGAPQKGTEVAPLAMRPLPGQAPEGPIRLFFDGGSKGNPGHGYGSYALDRPAYPRQVVRLQFGNRVTNNEAEYDTLIAALEAVLKRLAENGANPETAKVEIWGDSQLVINQVNGEWQSNKAELRMRRDKAQVLLKQFGQARLRYHGRENNVDILGH